MRCYCGHPWTGREYAGKIQRIGTADRDQIVGGSRSFLIPDGSKKADRLRKGELLTAYASHEVAASNFTPGFQPPIHAEEFEPRCSKRFPFDEPPKHHSVTSKERDRISLERGVAFDLNIGGA